MSRFTEIELTALCAAQDPPLRREQILLLHVDDDEIAARRVDSAEYAVLREAAQDNPDWQQLALQRAALGYAGRADAAAALAELLQEDPQIGDVLGSQLLAAAGHRAKVRAELGSGRLVTLHVALDLRGGPTWTIRGSRPGEGQWRDLRRAIAKGGEEAGALRCWELCVPSPPDVALYPALPHAVGLVLLGTTRRRVGDPSL